MTRTMARGTARRLISVSVAVSTALVASIALVDSASATPTILATAEYGGHTYHLLSSDTWTNSEAYAQSLGGHLVTIDSNEENAFVYDTFTASGTLQRELWIGLNDVASEGTFVWSSGAPVAYTRWAGTEPNNWGGNENWVHILCPRSSVAAGWNDYLDDAGGFEGCPLFGVVEIAGDIGPATPPAAPTQLTASYSESVGVTLAWTDNSSDEAGFTIERRPAGFSFARRDGTDANVTAYVDRLLYPSTTYTYRLRAFNSGGDSPWSNEASVTTAAGVPVPAPPLAPSYLVASLDTAGVDLAWTDNSADETRFALERAEGGAAFKMLATTPSDATRRDDDAVHPGWPYVYRVRALSLQGPSPYSNTAGASLAATWEMTLGAGSLTDSAKGKRDKLRIAGGYVLPGGAAFDPVAQGVEILAGPSNAPVAVSIAPADATWRSRKGKFTWKSPKAAASKASVAIVTKRGTVTVSMSGFDFAGAPGTAVTLLVASGPLGGGAAATWIERKPGSLRSE